MIYCFGTFDVDNYGDLLFPLLYRAAASSTGQRIELVSPTQSQPTARDAVATLSFSEFINTSHCINGIVVGGGHIVQGACTGPAIYLEKGLARVAYPRLWLAPTQLANSLGIPLLWNRVGVHPSSLTGNIRLAFPPTANVSVRDSFSGSALRSIAPNANITVGVDSALSASELLPHPKRPASLPPKRYIVSSFKQKYLESGAMAAKRVAQISRLMCADTVMIPMASCHNDLRALERVQSHWKLDCNYTTMPTDSSILEIVSAIAHSELYVGSSLHGAILAASYGVPFLLVANESKVGYKKFSGFLEQVSLKKDGRLFADWEHITPVVPREQSLGLHIKAAAKSLLDAFSQFPKDGKRVTKKQTAASVLGASF